MSRAGSSIRTMVHGRMTAGPTLDGSLEDSLAELRPRLDDQASVSGRGPTANAWATDSILLLIRVILLRLVVFGFRLDDIHY